MQTEINVHFKPLSIKIFFLKTGMLSPSAPTLKISLQLWEQGQERVEQSYTGYVTLLPSGWAQTHTFTLCHEPHEDNNAPHKLQGMKAHELVFTYKNTRT